MTQKLLRLCAIVIAIAFGHPALAEEGSVRLKTLDGQMTIDGTLLAFDGEFFRIQTEFGPVTLDGGNVTCEGSGCPPPEALIAETTIVGSSDLLTELITPLLSAFASRQSYELTEEFLADDHLRWSLIDTETTRLVARIEALSDAGEPDLSVSRGEPGLIGPADIIALDAIVAIVAPENEIATVSSETLGLMLEGRLKEWPSGSSTDSSDASRAIQLILPEELTGFDRIFPDRTLLRASDATRVDNVDLRADKVAINPNALGVAPLSRIGNAVPLVLLGTCGRALPATPSHLKAEDYPLTEPIFLTRLSPRLPRVIRDFVAFTKSSDAQPIVRGAGLVDQSIGLISFADQGDRLGHAVLAAGEDREALGEMRRMIRSLASAERLTLTFRFEDGSSELDPPSRSNVRQLADAIEGGQFDGGELVFAGFSDGLGDIGPNLRLSQRRAESVLAAVSAMLRDNESVELTTEGFGEALPMACDDTDWGRRVNRRVEVWIRARGASEN